MSRATARQEPFSRFSTSAFGSLVRPLPLRELTAERVSGEQIDAGTFEKVLKDCVAEVVQLQAQVGIDIPSDGEPGNKPMV